MAEAALEDKDALSQILAAHIPSGWPSASRPILHMYKLRLENDSSVFGWGTWFCIETKTKKFCGDMGFKGPAREKGGVEIGYGIQPEFQNKGYATEGVIRLSEWALSQADVQRVSAKCFQDNLSSIRVLEKAGFSYITKQENLKLWQKT